MDGRLSDEQAMLKDSLQRFLSAHYGFEQRARLLRAGPSSPEIWTAFAEKLGILAAPFDEDVGGLGGGVAETLVIAEELGRHLVTEPFVSTVVVAGRVLAEARRAEEVQAICEGRLTAALAYLEPQARFDAFDLETTATRGGDGWTLTGRKIVVRDAPAASHLIVSARTSGEARDRDGVSLFLVPASAAPRRDYPLLDGAMASDIVFDGLLLGEEALIGEEGGGLPALNSALAAGTLAVCAEAVGVMREMLSQTVDYTRQRKQFGKPLSSFQALQHRMVDMLIEIEQAQSITLMAANRPDDFRAVSAAKARIGKALKFVAQNAVHLHGGIGTTDELALSHYFRRATVIESQFGSADHHMKRYVETASRS